MNRLLTATALALLGAMPACASTVPTGNIQGHEFTFVGPLFTTSYIQAPCFPCQIWGSFEIAGPISRYLYSGQFRLANVAPFQLPYDFTVYLGRVGSPYREITMSEGVRTLSFSAYPNASLTDIDWTRPYQIEATLLSGDQFEVNSGGTSWGWRDGESGSSTSPAVWAPDPPVSLVCGPNTFHHCPPAAIPEPSTWAMLLTGFAALAYAGWRRTRRSALA